MFIRIEDWSNPLFLSQIERLEVAHENKLLKVFASYNDPRDHFDDDRLVIFDVSSDVFDENEVFAYIDREMFTGKMLEEKMQELLLSSTGKHIVRSLFRFANDIGVIDNIMSQTQDGRWVFDHPFDEINGIKTHNVYRREREAFIHIDIFHPSSLACLRKHVDIDNEYCLLGFREGYSFQKLMAEQCSFREKER